MPSEDIRDAYGRLFPLYVELAEVVARIISVAMRQEGVSVIVEHRAKSIDGLLEKSVRPGKSYADPLQEISDLAGVRLIVQSPELVHRVGSVIRAEFDVDESRSAEMIDELDPDRFGYLSSHFVVRFKPPRSGQLEYKSLAGLWAEVQVRTVLQHAWAQVSHFLLYKTKRDIPKHLQRRAYALAALFEIADRELDALIAAGSEAVEQSNRAIATSGGDVPIDVVSLRAFVESSLSVERWVREVESLGIGIGPIGMISRDVEMAHEAKLVTIADIELMLQRAEPWGAEYLRRFDENNRRVLGLGENHKKDYKVSLDRNGIVTLFLIASFPDVFTSAVLEQKFGWGQAWRALEAAESTHRRAE
jgi:ppGpp synthetase/RelA/SpoT-type nucleotidyltranferase